MRNYLKQQVSSSVVTADDHYAEQDRDFIRAGSRGN